MPFTITKCFTFSAAHHLDRLPASHPCSRQHGHNYTVTVELTADDTEVFAAWQKWVKDYGELKAFKDFLDAELDHRDLNEVLTFERVDLFDFTPTAEMLAYFLFNWCHNLWEQVSAVTVSETDKTTATYRRYIP